MMCLNAARMSEELNAKAIIGFTASGYTAFKVSSYRPKSTIYIFSGRHSMLGTLNLVRGVKCFYYDKYTSTDETIEDTIGILKEAGCVVEGDIVINTGSMPVEKKLRTNMVRVAIVE
jgi:pyruvate kinase